MKKNFTKFLSIVCAVAVLLTSTLPTFAADGKYEWSELWEQEMDNGVILFPGSDNSEMNVSWYSESESVPKVLLSQGSSLKADAKEFSGYSIETHSGDYSNKVTITGLEAGKTYSYKCISSGFESNVYSFKTDADENNFSAIYMTDIHVGGNEQDMESLAYNSENFSNVLNEAVEKYNPSILLSAGDQATSGLEIEYKGFASAVALKSIPVATTVGNHDRGGIGYKTFTNLPNENENAIVSSYIGEDYWFVKGDVLFLVLDSNITSGVDHRNFVKAAIEKNPNVKWKVMMAHHDLYSGRIPTRESENEFLRMIWAPIADEFKIDLVLLGHSHYYTVSNVLYDNEAVADFSNEMTDVAGTVYMVSGSINSPRHDETISLNDEFIGFSTTPDERVIYNVLDFTEDSITVSSYYHGEEEAFNSFSLNKTSNDGGHPESKPSLWDAIVRVVGVVYSWIKNIDVYIDRKEDGYNLKFFEFVFNN